MSLMRIICAICITGMLSGCEKAERKLMQTLDEFGQHLTGEKRQTVILKNAPLIIDEAGLTLSSSSPMQVLGTDSNVCLVLKSGVTNSATQDNIFASAMQNSKITTSLITKNGKSYALSGQGQAWSMFGTVTEGNELAACYSSCGSPLPIGQEISSIQIQAHPALKVLGVYWESTNVFDLIPAPKSTAKPDAPTLQTK